MKNFRLLMISTHGYVSSHPELGRPDTGGQVVSLLELSKALALRGIDVDILTRRFENQTELESVSDRVRIIRVPYAGNQFQPKETLAHFVPHLLESLSQRPRLLHKDYQLINSHYWDAGVAGDRLSKRWGIPHVHTPHSMGLLKRQNHAWGARGETSADNLDERIQQERVIYHRANLIVSTAAEQTRCLNQCDEYNVTNDKIAQIPPGVDVSLFHPDQSMIEMDDSQLAKHSAPVVFAAGRLASSKGYDLLIQAFPAVLQRIPTARLVLATGSMRPSKEEAQLLEELKTIAHHLAISARVTFINCVDQRRLASYYRSADVFVLCSRNEPFGMTAIEAMACGTPTVVTTRGGLWEELTWGHDCIYCDPVDSDALAHAICSPLLQPRIRQQLSKNGMETVHRRYTWNRIAEQFLDRYSESGWIERSEGLSPISTSRCGSF